MKTKLVLRQVRDQVWSHVELKAWTQTETAIWLHRTKHLSFDVNQQVIDYMEAETIGYIGAICSQVNEELT